MRVVITGGHGFVGTFLARELLARGAFRGRPLARLVLADRTSAPAPDLMDHPSVESVAGDLRQTLPRLFAEPVDAVFHLASAVSAECERTSTSGSRATWTSRAPCSTRHARSARPGGRRWS